MSEEKENKLMISVVMPLYNAEKYVSESINSVIHQNMSNWELVIIDDGSTDGSLNICQQFKNQHPEKIIIIQHENGVNKGVSETRSLGIKRSKGELIYFLDSDDILLPGTFGKYIEVFMRESDIGLVHSKMILLTNEEQKPDIESGFDMGGIERRYTLQDEPYFLQNNKICNSTVCVRRRCLEKVNLKSNQAFQVEDWVLWTLLSQFCDFYYVPINAIKYRYHRDSITYRVVKNQLYRDYSMLEYYFSVMAKSDSIQINSKCLQKINELLNSIFLNYSDSAKLTTADFTDILLREKSKILIKKNKSLLKKQNSGYYIPNLVYRFYKKFVR
jgi:glycosyltransferase involved in cell wall biosynthesis